IPKNDYGKGGAWDFYWGALYPKGGKRIAAPQLFVWINHAVLEFGFYVGEYGDAARARLRRRAADDAPALEQRIGERLSELGVVFGRQRDHGSQPASSMPFRDWLRDVASGEYHAAVVLPRADEEAMEGQ